MMVRKSKGITDKHIKVLEFLTDYQTKYGRPPSIREIGEKVKISSTSVVNYYLDQLKKMGYLERDDRVVGSAWRILQRIDLGQGDRVIGWPIDEGSARRAEHRVGGIAVAALVAEHVGHEDATLALDERSVSAGVEQPGKLGRIAELDLADPARPVWIAVDHFGLIGECVVDRNDGSRHRGVDVADRFRALDLAHRVAGDDGRTDRRHLDVHHIAERVLGVVGDPYSHPVALGRDPLVIAGVLECVGNGHGPQT